MKIAMLFVLAFVCESIVQIIGSSELFVGFRTFFKEPSKLYDLVNCKYCHSVWVAFIIILAYGLVLEMLISWWSLFWLIIGTFFVHRLSNWYHLLYDIVESYKVSRDFELYPPSREVIDD
jgi:hypothetical protein